MLLTYDILVELFRQLVWRYKYGNEHQEERPKLCSKSISHLQLEEHHDYPKEAGIAHQHPLGIYVTTHSAPLMGYLGNSTNLIKVIDMRGGSVTITGVVYSIAGYNMSSYVLVGPDDYYKFNFTNATFVGQYGD